MTGTDARACLEYSHRGSGGAFCRCLVRVEWASAARNRINQIKKGRQFWHEESSFRQRFLLAIESQTSVIESTRRRNQSELLSLPEAVCRLYFHMPFLAHFVYRHALPAAAGALALALVLAGTLIAAPPTDPNCSPNVVPTGQSNPPGSESEPMAPIWCFTLNPQGPPTRVTGANDWVDTFQGVTPMGRFDDGDLDYRVFDAVQNGGQARTQHFTNNNHWMDDNAGGFLGGAMIRPNRSFRFEGGKLVVEVDVAAGISGYLDPGGGDVAWPEVDISTADSPDGHPVVDGLYAYGRFGGFDTFGCRLHAGQKFTCSYEAARAGANGRDTHPCFEFSPARLVEISGFEACGTTHFGGDPGFGAPGQYFRTCDSVSQVPDMMCRDRFRLELTQDGLTAYVNGVLYFQDTGWPARNQLTEAIASGSTPVYVYLSDWQATPSQPAYRFHWARLAINPHAGDGSLIGPSAAPSFCLGEPHNTCHMASGAPSTKTPLPPTSTPAAADTPRPTGTARPANTPASLGPETSTPVAAGSTLLAGSRSIQPNVDSNEDGMAEAFVYRAAQTGVASKLTVYIDPSSTASSVSLGLYASANGHPSTLLAQGTVKRPKAGAWNSAAIPRTRLTSGTTYWIAILTPEGAGSIRFRDRASGGGTETSAEANLTSLPRIWSPGTRWGNSPASAYASP
jgi:hypothetical protein